MANMSEYPKLKLPDKPMLFTEQTDKALAAKPDPNFRYAYFKTIAKGGKSLIQSCKDLHLNRDICYKSLLPEFADDEIEQKRFLRESRVSAMLQHPNTVPTYELGRDTSGHYYFTMKLVHGYTLREIYDYRERYDLGQLVKIIVQVAYALEYAHSIGVIHRDIKPENVLIGPYGEVLLLDWGLAKVWDKEGTKTLIEAEVDAKVPVREFENASMTGFQQLQGTLFYMSPEQIERDPAIDLRSDIYSLGVLLYEALTGRTPAEGELVDDVIHSTLHDEPPRPSDITDNIPEQLEDAVMQCIKKRPENRVQSAGALIRKLQQHWSLV